MPNKVTVARPNLKRILLLQVGTYLQYNSTTEFFNFRLSQMSSFSEKETCCDRVNERRNERMLSSFQDTMRSASQPAIVITRFRNTYTVLATATAGIARDICLVTAVDAVGAALFT